MQLVRDMVKEKAMVQNIMVKLRRTWLLQALVVLAVMSVPVVASLAAFGASTHLDRSKNPGGCSSCHRGHGKRGTPMLAAASKQEMCFTCHGLSLSANAGAARTDMQTVFSKRYKHPVVESAGFHRPAEELPERNAGAPRHVACEDCHKTHEVTAEKPLARIKGYSRTRAKVKEARDEYEVCYNCHADSANLPLGSKNKRLEFDQNNLSYHPVEVTGKNMRVPSLTRGLNVMSTITCSDCHGNDDPRGPRGPHGSNIPGMLRYDYVTNETAESPLAYALCYACHDRSSILNNESFKTHKEHIVFNHIPCAACHVSHGTEKNQHLIEFPASFVGFVPLPAYMPALDGKPTCLLNCHVSGRNVLHDSAFYKARDVQRLR
jgi:predicted CXXCH cytochrome family protein